MLAARTTTSLATASGQLLRKVCQHNATHFSAQHPAFCEHQYKEGSHQLSAAEAGSASLDPTPSAMNRDRVVMTLSMLLKTRCRARHWVYSQ